MWMILDMFFSEILVMRGQEALFRERCGQLAKFQIVHLFRIGIAY